jgi:hypothetical protein
MSSEPRPPADPAAEGHDPNDGEALADPSAAPEPQPDDGEAPTDLSAAQEAQSAAAAGPPRASRMAGFIWLLLGVLVAVLALIMAGLIMEMMAGDRGSPASNPAPELQQE